MLALELNADEHTKVATRLRPSGYLRRGANSSAAVVGLAAV